MVDQVLAAPIFEGSEKRIEVDFRLDPNASAKGLRAIPRETLDELMTLARCCIVSSRSNEDMDAYVLSESSCFVYPTKWVLKTCGTTLLLNSVPRLLEVARALGLEPRRCKYTRASFLFPENQPFPYTAYEHEVSFLDEHFGDLSPNGSSAFVLGEPFQGLQWHVYLADDMRAPEPGFKPTYNFEVCMTELAADAAQQFIRDEKFVSSERTTRDTGIIALKPRALIDDYVFEPCGYSMNGIDGTGLITIHVTPEAHQSYASVEFSGYGEDLVDQVEALSKVVKIFQPGKVSVTLSVDKVDMDVTRGAFAAGLQLLPPGYGLQGMASQVSPCGGKVSYYTLADKLPATPGSPTGPLHHAASFLSMVTSSDSEVDAGSEPDQEVTA